MTLFDLFGPDSIDDGEYMLYHLTPTEHLPSVLRYGLVQPAADKDRQFQREQEDISGIFLLEELEFVPDYLDDFRRIHEGDFSLLEVRVPFDTEAVKDTSGIAAVIVADPIPPEKIRHISIPLRRH